ncbi:ABC transporter permease [Tropicimonas sp. IMCC34043]|uniref:ABC transporter permease n=1 Tax=Tropicimonas sp. IMCC34043 TaxID=2248760 RepID=UPI000E25B74B|nr:ABC transporter permease [Tropicimonas sp. IMCC34043]
MIQLRNLVFLVLEKHLIWALLAILFLVGLTVPGFFSSRNILNVMWAAAPLGCMVLGLFFVVLTGGLDLSLESTFALAPTLAVVLFFQVLPFESVPVLPVLGVLVFGGIIGLLNGLFAVKLRVSPFLVTLGTLLLMRGLVVWLIPEGIYYLPDSFVWLGAARLWGVVPVAVVIWIGVYLLAWLIVERHRLGKDILALGNNEQAAFIAGVNIDRTKILCFVLAGVLASLGGVLEVGRLQSVVADLGEGDILMVFAGAILGGTALTGGKGNVGGIFAAVLVIAIIENLMNLYGVPPSIRQVVFGAVMLVAIYLASLQDRLRHARIET